jgi:hypothetical protein
MIYFSHWNFQIKISFESELLFIIFCKVFKYFIEPIDN